MFYVSVSKTWRSWKLEDGTPVNVLFQILVTTLNSYMESILTKDNLMKRNWKGDPICHLCDEEKNIAHLPFLFALQQK